MALVTLPFSGFYQSLHDTVLDDTIERMFTDRDTGCERNEGLESALVVACDFAPVREKYAAAYAVAFGQEFKIDTLKFESLTSPRFYNFETDRVFATVTKKELARIYRATNRDDLTALVKSMFTSRDGFHSFYSGDLAEWGPVNTWDHNQYSALLRCYAVQECNSGEFSQYDEYNLVEDLSGNGHLDNWIAEATPGIERLYKVHDYLETRRARDQ